MNHFAVNIARSNVLDLFDISLCTHCHAILLSTITIQSFSFEIIPFFTSSNQNERSKRWILFKNISIPCILLFIVQPHLVNCFFLSFAESSSHYRERKEKNVSSSESDDDEYGASADYSIPTSNKSKFQLQYIQQFLKHKLGFSHEDEGDADTHQVLKTVDFPGLLDHWKRNGFKKIVTMAGAGISTCKLIEIHGFHCKTVF